MRKKLQPRSLFWERGVFIAQLNFANNTTSTLFWTIDFAHTFVACLQQKLSSFNFFYLKTTSIFSYRSIFSGCTVVIIVAWSWYYAIVCFLIFIWMGRDLYLAKEDAAALAKCSSSWAGAFDRYTDLRWFLRVLMCQKVTRIDISSGCCWSHASGLSKGNSAIIFLHIFSNASE